MDAQAPRPARNLDPVDSILLLLSLIILLNLGINVMILIWRSLMKFLRRTFDFFQPKGNIPKRPEPSEKKPTGVPTLCIHCTLDPVALSVAHPASDRHHRHRERSGSCHDSYWGSRRSRRRHGRQQHLQYQHHTQASLTPPPPPSPASPPTSYHHQETWDTDLEDHKESWNQQQTWDYPGNIRHYRGYWSTYYPGGANLPPQDLRAPRRVEAKSELRLETYYQSPPNSWPHNLKNMEPGPLPTSPQFTHRFPPNPSWMPGTPTALPPGGQIFYDGWEVRQRVRDGNRGADVPRSPRSPSRSNEPHSYAENIVLPQSLQRSIENKHTPVNRAHVSAGHLPCGSRDRPEIKRWDRERGEPLPPRTSIGPSLSFCRLPIFEPQNYCGPTPNQNLIPEVSQPLSHVSARVPARVPAPDPGRAPAFIPLSRSPGGLTNYQMYDSLELKRQVQERQGRREPRPGG